MISVSRKKQCRIIKIFNFIKKIAYYKLYGIKKLTESYVVIYFSSMAVIPSSCCLACSENAFIYGIMVSDSSRTNSICFTNSLFLFNKF